MSGAEILVSGATGRTGGAAIAELLKMGRHVRAYVRSDGEQASALREQGVEIALGDFTDIDAIRAAMEGVRSAYFLYPIAPGILGAAAYFAEAAKEAGVTAIVNMSQISARRESASHAAQDHWVSERIFDWSGVPTTHLRPTFFADWLVYPHFAKEIWAKKKIEFPFANGRHAPIASEDQGRVIAHILADPKGHEGKIYTLHGPVEMNQTEIAAAMSEVLGSRIDYAPTSIEAFKDRMENLYKFPSLPRAASGRSRPELSGRNLLGRERCRRDDHRDAATHCPAVHRSEPSCVRLNMGADKGDRKMSQAKAERHPFLDDLTADAELIRPPLRGPVIGRDEIRLAVGAVGRFYASQTPTFLQSVGPRLFLEYEAHLTNGEKLSAVVVVDRNPDGSVPRVSVRMSPLGAVLSLAAHLREALSKRLPDDLFL